MKTQARQQNSKGPQTELDRVYSRSQDETRRLISSLMVDEGEDQSVAESVEKEHAPVAFEPTPLARGRRRRIDPGWMVVGLVLALVVAAIAFGVLFSRVVARGATSDAVALGIYAAGFFLHAVRKIGAKD